jgi:crotonobetainyl-CoA:carnitine CoA-transferase CaiB-like acyl-CoA transferase
VRATLAKELVGRKPLGREALPLSSLRVVEIGALPAAAYAARLLADFGAEVIKL